MLHDDIDGERAGQRKCKGQKPAHPLACGYHDWGAAAAVLWQVTTCAASNVISGVTASHNQM